jgi:putative transcriptional regulator
MAETLDLSHHLLIAMPALADDNFRHTVSYLCEHGEHGALGVIVNRPLEITLGDLLEQVGLKPATDAIAGQPVYGGGPVQPNACLILHRPLGRWDSTLPVTEQIGLTGSMDLLASIARGAGPEDFLVCLGYAGWGAGQLEQELADNAWLTVPGRADVLFEIAADQRWRAAAASIGVDIALLPKRAGHA